MKNMQTEVKRNSLRAWLLATRPKTLTGAAVPVMIGLSAAYADACRMEMAETFSWTAADRKSVV